MKKIRFKSIKKSKKQSKCQNLLKKHHSQIRTKAKLLNCYRMQNSSFMVSKIRKQRSLCLTSLEACKREVQSTSFLSRQSAQDTMAQYNQAQISVNELEESVSKYLDLFSFTYQDNIANETDEENQDKLQQIIDQNFATLNEYCTKFDNIRRLNLEIFQEINIMLNPIQRTFVKPVQAAHQTSIQAPGNKKIKLKCRNCNWETGKLKYSKANQ